MFFHVAYIISYSYHWHIHCEEINIEHTYQEIYVTLVNSCNTYMMRAIKVIGSL